MKGRLADRMVLVEQRAGRMVVVIDGDDALIEVERAWLANRGITGLPPVEPISRVAWETMQRLIEAGMLRFTDGASHLLYRNEDQNDVRHAADISGTMPVSAE